MANLRWLMAATVVLLLAHVSVLAQETNDPDYQRGYAAWTMGRYPDASTLLSRYRAKPFGERMEVDYWLGTSWCRIWGQEKDGWDMLDWAMYSYPLTEPTRLIFKRERDLCRELGERRAETHARPAVIGLRPSGSGATSRAEQTKIFYIPGGNMGALRTSLPKFTREIPLQQLEARLVSNADPPRAEQTVKGLVPEFRVETHGHFVLASGSAHGHSQLVTIGRTLESFLAFLDTEFGLKSPQRFITVYMVPDGKELRVLANRLHGLDVSPSTLGYAFESDLSVVGVLTGIGVGTLLHELFHVVVRVSYGPIPQWLDEGMASVYETCTLVDGRFLGEPNWRGIVLKALQPGFDGIGLQQLITAHWFSDESPTLEPGRTYSQEAQAYMMALARYFALYLQEQGKLVGVFRAYRDRKRIGDFVTADQQAVMLVEAALRAKLDPIESDFWQWARPMLNPAKRLHTGKASSKQLPVSLDREPGRFP